MVRAVVTPAGRNFWADVTNVWHDRVLDPLAGAEHDVRIGMRNFERDNRDTIQQLAAGGACIAGIYFAGTSGTVACIPLLAGGTGLVDPTNPGDLAADLQAYEDAGGLWRSVDNAADMIESTLGIPRGWGLYALAALFAAVGLVLL